MKMKILIFAVLFMGWSSVSFGQQLKSFADFVYLSCDPSAIGLRYNVPKTNKYRDILLQLRRSNGKWEATFIEGHSERKLKDITVTVKKEVVVDEGKGIETGIPTGISSRFLHLKWNSNRHVKRLG